MNAPPEDLQQRRGRRQLLLLAALFFVPLAIAFARSKTKARMKLRQSHRGGKKKKKTVFLYFSPDFGKYIFIPNSTASRQN